MHKDHIHTHGQALPYTRKIIYSIFHICFHKTYLITRHRFIFAILHRWTWKTTFPTFRVLMFELSTFLRMID